METSISLYNIKNKFIELFEKSENGELTSEEAQEQGNDLALALKNKSASIIGYIRNLELTSEAMEKEINRITANKKMIDNSINRFKEYVKENMEDLCLPKITTDLGTLKISKNPVSVEIIDEEIIDKKYLKTKIEVKPDKTAIKKDLQKGIQIAGARLIEDKTRLDIV